MSTVDAASSAAGRAALGWKPGVSRLNLQPLTSTEQSLAGTEGTSLDLRELKLRTEY